MKNERIAFGLDNGKNRLPISKESLKEGIARIILFPTKAHRKDFELKALPTDKNLSIKDVVKR